MAQYIGFAPAPADLPGLNHPVPTIMPTMPTTTAPHDTRDPRAGETGNAQVNGQPSSPADDSVYETTKPRPTRRFLAACVAVASRAANWGLAYRYELAPGATAGMLTALGWWQHATPQAGTETFWYSVAGLAAATAAGYGHRKEDNRLFGAGAAVAVALGEVAVSTSAGLGAASLTVATLGAGLAYAAYVPWLVGQRKDHKHLAVKPKPEQPVNAVAAVPAAPPKADKPQKRQVAEPFGQSFWETAGQPMPTDAQTPTTQRHATLLGPFHDLVIPYADDDSNNVKDPLRLGWDEYGSSTDLTMLYRHTLVAGASDWGKSGIINLIIKKLLRKKHVELYGIDLKPGAPELGPWAPLFKRLARTPEEVRELFDELDAKARRRGEQLERISQQKLAGGEPPVRKWIPGDPSLPEDGPGWGHGTATFLITDELGELIRQDESLRKQEAEARKADPEFGPPLETPLFTRYESGLSLWRSLCIQFVSATQQPSGKIFGGRTDARGNYANRISTRAGEARHAQLVFGEGCRGLGFTPERLTRPGEFFIASAEHQQENPPRCRTEYVTDEDIAADVAPYYRSGSAKPQAPKLSLVKPEAQSPVVKPAAALFPDGSEVKRGDWPDLYRVFCELCAEQGFATKDDLTGAGPFSSRDTVRRAVDVWLTRGVQVRKVGKSEQFFLPETDDDTTADSDD